MSISQVTDKNGQKNLTVMNISEYDQLLERKTLYSKLTEGLKDIKEGRVEPFDFAMADIRKEFGI